MAAAVGVVSTGELALRKAEKQLDYWTARAEKARSRTTLIYDYEKVFWNSIYTMGIGGLVWGAIRLGRLFVAATGALNWIDDAIGSITGNPAGIISDEAVIEMQKIDATVLNKLDQLITPYLPLLPLGAVGGHTAAEWLRVRKNYPEQERKAGDALFGVGGIIALFAANAAYQDYKKYVPPTKPNPDQMSTEWTTEEQFTHVPPASYRVLPDGSKYGYSSTFGEFQIFLYQKGWATYMGVYLAFAMQDETLVVLPTEGPLPSSQQWPWERPDQEMVDYIVKWRDAMKNKGGVG